MVRANKTDYRVAIYILLIGLLIASGAGAQESRPRKINGQEPGNDETQTIRVGTKLVNVFFTVTDKKNNYVNDLMKSEVTVLENGRQQEIFTFKREFNLPLTMAILVDVSNSVIPVLPQLTDASYRFIDSVMKPDKDRTAIIQFNSEPLVMQDLTSNVNRLHKGLKDIVANFIPKEKGPRGLPPLTGVTGIGGTSIYDSIIATCTDMLAGKQGRKMIILFTDGYDTTSQTKRSDAVEEALRAEAVIYAIAVGDPRDQGVNKSELNRICEPTGGRAFIPRDVEDLDRAFNELEQEMRQQYLLAYEPINDRADGSFRRIEVRTTNRKGAHIHHRQGYYADR
ncbi:MAG: VWA domain-containing protein [Blastocatellia bacterium]|nr:VWA domain-containing protein [Blastocatellia bacterium]